MVDHKTPVLLLICLTTMLMISGWASNASKQFGQTYPYAANYGYVGHRVSKKYVGEYRDGKKHGQGTNTYADGRVKEGIWKNDVFQYARKG